MKISIFSLLLCSLLASPAFACDDISGTYESTDKSIGKRVYTITQNGCDYKLQLNNAGANVDPDIVRADNAAYDRSQPNFDSNGHVISPFRPLSSSSTGLFRATSGANSLYRNNVDARPYVTNHVWSSVPLSTCQEQFGLQVGCSFLQIVLTKNADNTLLETQNGYRYYSGNMVPVYIHYKKIN